MQFHRRKVEGQQVQVLHDEHVDPRLVQLPHQPAGLQQLIIFQQGIDRREDTGTVQVRMAAEPGYLLHGIARRRPGAERRPRNINGIGTTVDGCDADIRIARWREQLEA